MLSARRIAERCTAVRSPCAPGAFSATAPKSQARPSASATRSTAPPEDSAIAIPRRRPAGPRRRRRTAIAIPSSETATIPPISSAPARADGRRVGRVRAVGQERGAEAAAEEGADREAPEAEHAHDQALLVPPERHRQGEGDDHPVEAGHGFPNTSARATTFADVNPPVTRSRTREGEAPPPGRPARPPRAQRGPLTERQRRLRRRALPLAVVAVIAFIFGVISAAGSPEQDMAERFVKDWADQDYNSMHDELSDSAQAQYSAADLRSAYADAQNASTATAIDPGSADGPKNVNGTDVVDVGVGVRTKLFGKVDGILRLPLDGGKVAWNPNLTFPGLHTGERVGRRLTLGRRASILAKHGTALAHGTRPTTAARPLGSDAIDVAGETGAPDTEEQAKLQEAGYPSNEDTGVSGLELAFNDRLAGKPSGQLLAVKDGHPAPGRPGEHARAAFWPRRTAQPGSRSGRRSTRTCSRPP